MKFKFIAFFISALMPAIANATAPSIFSTSVDWEAITALRLTQTRVNFIPDLKLIQNGLELYFLDGFPCFGQTGMARIWIGQKEKDTDGEIRLTCAHVPETVNFAWRNADRDASQNKTTGILTCPTSGKTDITIDLSKCTTGKKWEEYK